MAKSDSSRISRADVAPRIDALRPTSRFDHSLFSNLVTEGVFSENRWRNAEVESDVVYLTYERFADHLLAKYLLDKHLNANSPEAAFRSPRKLGEFLKTESGCWKHGGLIEAFSVQLPERIGRELADLAPHARSFRPVKHAFVASLIWRDAAAFSDKTLEYLYSLCDSTETRSSILDAMLTVAPVPDHPLNAERLHQLLSSHSMPERDVWWTTFLHWQWGAQQAVDRLVEWAWVDSVRHNTPDDVVVLAGTAISWFLTSPHRFLRDRATKALITLFERKGPPPATTLRLVLGRRRPIRPRATDGGRPRLCNAPTDPKDLPGLAKDVVDHIFRGDRILPQLLTRDYARGIVECAKARGVIAASAFQESYPPYASN